jgi:hypothetical protein
MGPYEKAEIFLDRFLDDLRERVKYVKVHCRDDVAGDDDGLLWHFTRFSVFKSILRGGQLWLSNLALCNDADEVHFGLHHVPAAVRRVSKKWSNRDHARVVDEIATRAQRRFTAAYEIYALSLSDERDTTGLWNTYGGGVQAGQSPDDPHVAIAFEAGALFEPQDLSDDNPFLPAFNLTTGSEAAEILIGYWALKARKCLEALAAHPDPAAELAVIDAMERTLLLVSAIVKGRGWADEHEFRVLFVDRSFGERTTIALPRPDGRGFYVPLSWKLGQNPIRRVMPHPLSDSTVIEDLIRSEPMAAGIDIVQSTLRPRRRA